MKDCDSPYRSGWSRRSRTACCTCAWRRHGGELFNHLSRVGGSIPERDARFYAACVVLAFQYLQNKHYIYRDLKPENCSSTAKGTLRSRTLASPSGSSPARRRGTLCGTRSTCPQSCTAGHNKAVDWWALGVLIYEMVAAALRRFILQTPTAPTRCAISPRSTRSRACPGVQGRRRRFLSVNAVHRLGSLKGGVKDVKLHPWFNHRLDRDDASRG